MDDDDARTFGWLSFSAVVLIFAGVFRVFDAIWAFRYDGELPDNLEGALFGTTLSTYGWLWLAVAALLILSGIALLGGSQLGRWVGIVAAAFGGLSAAIWIPFYPVWSLVYVVMALLVLYGLTVYGGRPKPGDVRSVPPS